MKNNSRIKFLVVLAVVLCLLTVSLAFIVNRYARSDARNVTSARTDVSGRGNGVTDVTYDNVNVTDSGTDVKGDDDAGLTGSDDIGVLSGGDVSKSDILLVNADNPLPEDYYPDGLVSLFEKKDRHFQLARADIEVSETVFAAMDKMFAAAQLDGIEDFIITSGYRSSDRQAELLEEDDGGFAAQPGKSEHGTGLAFDVVAMGNEDFERTPHFEWLYAHCAEYGFILRYPEGAEDITGFPYESWHYRYVGTPHAAAIMDAGITLEQYLNQ